MINNREMRVCSEKNKLFDRNDWIYLRNFHIKVLNSFSLFFRWLFFLYIICDKTQSLSFNRLKTKIPREKKNRNLLVSLSTFPNDNGRRSTKEHVQK